ncbi:hypothetical protein QUB63_35120 [Microcoleus sp. ARI1-B5]|uniref:hypothetical protein n=1 Tax=unclassified Microcoleus TaxID=2642155 RepID=UPI002FD358EB
MNARKQDEMAVLIDKVILDPILLRKLSDIVYELMLEELRNTRDRAGNYRRTI